MSLTNARGLDFGEAFHWDDIAWIRELWDCPIIVKGVMSVGDAQRAINIGADAIVVSNHGGNRLDGDGRGDRCAAVDRGSSRSSGRNTLRRWRSTWHGCRQSHRPSARKRSAWGVAYLYPLIAAGERGVSDILHVFKRDIENTLALLGCSSLDQIRPEHVVRRVNGSLVPAAPSAVPNRPSI